MPNVATKGVADGIGLREFRANLSGYIEHVKTGRTLTLTDRGRAVARLVPAEGQSSYERLVAQGVIQPAASRPDHVDAPIQANGPVSDLISGQRR
jgi:prevent-host-death family protein